MSYCVALRLSSGLVFMADTRTNAGVDNVSRYPKIHTWSVQGELQIYLLSAEIWRRARQSLAIYKSATKHLMTASWALCKLHLCFRPPAYWARPCARLSEK